MVALRQGRPAHLGLQATPRSSGPTCARASPWRPARASPSLHVAYDGGGLGLGAGIRLLVDGVEVGEGRIERTLPYMFSMDQTLDVGIDRGTPVTPDYGTRDGFAFTGRIESVAIATGEDALQPSVEQQVEAALVVQ
ncbi:hypothetical protein G5V59_15945 [Nocardioides sp. W3-2-3]|uniref:hypothetical protein n=1 Tax=Nocardioides convexus TaxID=2712224 RepID=UPI0024189EA9|nr:hypothetical protein [Nocardioides convexus]NHA00904.1 hypothetical protein [Nocardioides convexus]